MTINELRIGNWIYWDILEKQGVPHEVHGLRQNAPQTIPISLGDSIDEYKPIPLNKEWLDRMEMYQKGMNLFEYYGPGGFGDLGCAYEVLYVHQLQNLFFALFGRELPIH
jgi:hypothetical protein